MTKRPLQRSEFQPATPVGLERGGVRVAPDWPFDRRPRHADGAAPAGTDPPDARGGPAITACNTDAGLLQACATPGLRSFGGVYTDDKGSLEYDLYMPAVLAEHPPLFVMLHGAMQTASDFAIGTRMPEVVQACGGIVLFPQQSRNANPMGSWNWYDSEQQAADGGEPSRIAGLTRFIAAEHAVDRRRIYVGGMSAGGAMAVILGQAYPGVFAAVGVHSGLAHGVAHDLLSALRTMNHGPAATWFGQPKRLRTIPTIVFHGDLDKTVHPLNAGAVLAQALRLEPSPAGASVIPAVVPTAMLGGRDVTVTSHRRRRAPAHGELWMVHGMGHAWAGGNAQGSYTEESGPDASREMLRFFLAHSLAAHEQPARA